MPHQQHPLVLSSDEDIVRRYGDRRGRDRVYRKMSAFSRLRKRRNPRAGLIAKYMRRISRIRLSTSRRRPLCGLAQILAMKLTVKLGLGLVLNRNAVQLLSLKFFYIAINKLTKGLLCRRHHHCHRRRRAPLRRFFVLLLLILFLLRRPSIAHTTVPTTTHPRIAKSANSMSTRVRPPNLTHPHKFRALCTLNPFTTGTTTTTKKGRHPP